MHETMWMMALFALSLAVAGAGCGDDDGMAGMDAGAEGESCLEIITCGAGCAGNPDCQVACAADGSPEAIAQFEALNACALSACTDPPEGEPSCTGPSDGSPECSDCVANAAQGEGCSEELNACLGG